MIPSRSSGEIIASCKLALFNGVVRSVCGLARDATALEVGGTGLAEVACGVLVPACARDACGSVFI